MKPIEHRIKRMVERIELSEYPSATEAIDLLSSAYDEGQIDADTAAMWADIAKQAAFNQKRRLMQRDYLIQSGAVKC